MRYKIGSISILLVTIFVLLIEGCATTFLTPNIKQPVTLSKKIGINGLEIPSDVKTKGSIYGEILLERTYSQTSSSTEEKASAEVEFLSCLQASNSRFASNLSFKVIEILETTISQVEIVHRTREGIKAGLSLEDIKGKWDLKLGPYPPDSIKYADELILHMGDRSRSFLNEPLCAIFVNLNRWQIE